MRIVRPKNLPTDEPIEVTEAEYLDLVRQGLVEPQEPENDKNATGTEPAAEPATRTRAPRTTQGQE